MLTSAGILIGGLGLLLIGMGLMTDGLKIAAGNTLRNILALWTKSRLRGLLSGFLITGIVQSSSAITVATIGFANTGMLSLERALWVIFGSNVGTTMTAWMVALIGFNVDIESFALPVVGIGAVIKLTGGNSRRSSIGTALVGFGLLFMGIGTLKSAFDSFSSDFNVPSVDSLTLVSVFTYVGIGILLTTLMQSSSAAMVIALSAAESGLMPFNATAAIVIGANLGTTTTAILTVFGATPTAKRVALGHVFFNVITAVVAIFLLTPMLWLVNFTQSRFGMEPSPALTLALFHTFFNIMGVVLMFPLAGWLVSLLNRYFQTIDEIGSRPKFLDKNVLALPYIAIDALTLEMTRIAMMSTQLLQESFQKNTPKLNFHRKVTTIRNLAIEIGDYAAQINKTELTPFLAEVLVSVLHSAQEYLITVDISEDIAGLGELLPSYQDSNFAGDLESFLQATEAHLDAMTPEKHPGNMTNLDYFRNVESTYDTLKQAILRNASFGNLSMNELDILLQYANQIKRGCRHLWKGARRLNSISDTLQRNEAGKVVESSATDSENIASLQNTEQVLAEENRPAGTLNEQR